MRFLKRVAPGEMVPFGYGLAYRDILVKEYVCAPIPFNFIVGVARDAYLRLIYGPVRYFSRDERVDVDEIRAEAFHKGWLAGRNDFLRDART